MRDKKIFSVLFVILAFFTVIAAFPMKAFAEDEDDVYRNPETGYEARIIDKDLYLKDKDEDKKRLLEKMSEFTQYGNAVFLIGDGSAYKNEEVYGYTTYNNIYDKASGMCFTIDMSRRQLNSYCWKDVLKVVTKSYQRSIVDNVYTYAGRGDYCECAYQAFDQALSLMQGQKISQPMKHVNNALLALSIAIILMYIYANATAAMKKSKENEILKGILARCEVVEKHTVFTHESKTYSPQSSSSGSSGGGGGGFSGGGGGGGGGGASHGF